MGTPNVQQGIQSLIRRLEAYQEKKKNEREAGGMAATAKAAASYMRTFAGGASQLEKDTAINDAINALNSALDILNENENPYVQRKLCLSVAEQVVRLENLGSSKEYNEGQLRDENIKGIMRTAADIKGRNLRDEFNSGNSKLERLYSGDLNAMVVQDDLVSSDDNVQPGYADQRIDEGIAGFLSVKDKKQKGNIERTQPIHLALDKLQKQQQEVLKKIKDGNLDQKDINQLKEAYNKLAIAMNDLEPKIRENAGKRLVTQYIEQVNDQRDRAVKGAEEILKLQSPPKKPAIKNATQSEAGKEKTNNVKEMMKQGTTNNNINKNSTGGGPTRLRE